MNIRGCKPSKAMLVSRKFYIMIDRFISRSLLLVLGCSLVLPVFADVQTTSPATGDSLTATSNSDKSMAPYHVTPGPADGKIAFVTATLLQQTHFSKQPFDATVSSKFLDHYLEALDPQHLHFLQSDLAEFERYRTKLGEMTVSQRRAADTRPACEIFERFIQRFQQRVAYVDELLKNEKFTFDTDEKISLSRKEQPYPKDLNEAKQLWMQRLRFEYLQEKLGKHDAKKKAAKSGKDSAKKPDAKPKTEAEEIVDTLTHTYHRRLHSFTGWNNEDVLQVYLDTLAHLYDPYSDYMGPSHLDSFSISMNLSLSGIGAELTTSPDGYCTINRLLPGGPAAKSKQIKEKDRIVAVAQGDKTPVDVVDMNLNKVVQMIRGPKGTEVRLTILPEGAALSETNVVTLIWDEVKIEDSAAKAKIIELPNSQGETVRVGVINLPSFYAPFDFSSRKTETGTNDANSGRSTT